MDKTALAHLIVARIFLQQRWIDRADHEIFIDAVEKTRSVTLGIAERSLPVAWVAVRRLADPRQQANVREFDRIEGASPLKIEFLLGCQRLDVFGIFNRSEIGLCEEQTIVRSGGRFTARRARRRALLRLASLARIRLLRSCRLLGVGRNDHLRF